MENKLNSISNKMLKTGLGADFALLICAFLVYHAQEFRWNEIIYPVFFALIWVTVLAVLALCTGDLNKTSRENRVHRLKNIVLSTVVSLIGTVVIQYFLCMSYFTSIAVTVAACAVTDMFLNFFYLLKCDEAEIKNFTI